MVSNLLVFRHELPDLNQELSVQHTSSFTLFLELPLELRQIIWRKTFPKVTHYWSYYNDSVRWCHLSPPMASCINQESRMETLRQYTILEHRMEYNYDTTLHTPKCTFWNPAKDTIKPICISCLDPAFSVSLQLTFMQYGRYSHLLSNLLCLWTGYGLNASRSYWRKETTTWTV
jgi:hypothetical protein